jgi:hypothetical protein
MNLDTLKNQWAAQDSGFDIEVAIRVKTAGKRSRTGLKWLLRRHSLFVLFNQAMVAVCIVLNGIFIGNHFRETRFLIPAIVLHLAMIGLIVADAFQHEAVSKMNFDGPLADVQKRIEKLAILRVRINQFIFLLAPAFWPVLLVLLLKGMLGVDAFAVFPPLWLIANVAFGLLWIPFAWFIVRTFGERFSKTRFGKSVIDDLTGKRLLRARAWLKELADLEER